MPAPESHGPITRFEGPTRFLSNFSPAKVELVDNLSGQDGIIYQTAEHAYQAAKTADLRERIQISRAHTPGEAGRAGRQVTLRADWEQIKRPVMLQVVLAKFSQRSPVLAHQLAATGDRLLVEGNAWHDNYWGNCTCARCPRPGSNYLGQILMAVRLVLRP